MDSQRPGRVIRPQQQTVGISEIWQRVASPGWDWCLGLKLQMPEGRKGVRKGSYLRSGPASEAGMWVWRREKQRQCWGWTKRQTMINSYVPTLRGTWHHPRGLVQGPVRLSWWQLQDLHGLCEQTSWAIVKQSGARPQEKGTAREPLSWGLRLEEALIPAGCMAEKGKFCLEPAGPRAACFCAELGCQKLWEGVNQEYWEGS